MSASKLTLKSWPQSALKVDRVALVLMVILLALLVVNRAQALATVEFTLAAILHVLPFLLLSISIAAYAKASGADNLIARAFQGRTLPMIACAAAMGALSPFCSCGVIPLIAALLTMGVPLAPVMAFWLASPLMDPSMFVLTTGTLGVQFALAKTAAAIGVGLLGGFGIWMIQRSGGLAQPLREGNGSCGGSAVRAPKPLVWRFWHDDARRSAFMSSARDNLLFLGKWLTLAFVLESLMLAFVPADWVIQAVGGNGWLPVVGAALVGVPAYLNGYAALPLVGGLIEQGMAPGAGMAFLIAGGVTSIPAAIAVYALARPPVFFAYLSFAFIGAITAGLLYGLL